MQLSINKFFMAAAALTVCGTLYAGSKASPAQVSHKTTESALSTITLTPKAEQRLGIETFAVEAKRMPKIVRVGGEVVAVPAQTARVAAPVGGIVLGADGRTPLRVGITVKKDQPVMRLLPMPPQSDIVGTKEKLAVKQVEYDVKRAALERVKQLLEDRAASEKDYEQAQADFSQAAADLKAAKARVDFMESKNLDTVASDLSAMILSAPFDGVIQRIDTAAGQTVSASAPLFEITNFDTVWIRIPVYSGLLPKIDMTVSAEIALPGTDKQEMIAGTAVRGAPLSDAASASSDLYYAVDNRQQNLRIGQKVSAVLKQKSAARTLVVPWSAVVYDMFGGSWVYVKEAAQRYARQRVEVSHVSDGMAVLTRGVEVGQNVVTAGAAELFGTEFGSGK